MNLEQNLVYTKMDIVSGTTSTEADLKGLTPVGLLTPANLASTALTFTAGGLLGGIGDFELNAVGSGYAENDVLTVTQNGASLGTITVLTVEAGGEILTYEIGDAGSGYAVGEVVALDAGNTDATFEILTIDTLGEVLTVKQLNTGTGYTVANGVASVSDGDGLGLTINILTAGALGRIDTYELTTAGSGYFPATGLATTVAPAGGTGATVNISTVDGSTYYPLAKSDNTALSYVVSNAGKQYLLNPNDFAGVKKIKLVLGSSETAKTFYLILRAI
jgi:hypothetical protein